VWNRNLFFLCSLSFSARRVTAVFFRLVPSLLRCSHLSASPLLLFSLCRLIVRRKVVFCGQMAKRGCVGCAVCRQPSWAHDSSLAGLLAVVCVVVCVCVCVCVVWCGVCGVVLWCVVCGVCGGVCVCVCVVYVCVVWCCGGVCCVCMCVVCVVWCYGVWCVCVLCVCVLCVRFRWKSRLRVSCVRWSPSQSLWR
jgi:hypothetical protein